jgi:predicted transcriptional regulator of viral defense system
MTDTDTRLEGIKPRDLPDWLLSHGSAFTTTAEIARLLGIPAKEVAPIAARWRSSQQAFSPSPGTYVPIPSQFRSWGTVPASHFIDPLMNHLGHPYYVGYLSAAEVHDAAHQRPQIFQIVTTARLARRTFGRVRLGFIVSKTTTNKPTTAINTPTGTMTVSTPEVTVLDLVGDPGHGGGLSNVATIIADLLEDDKLDINQLVNAAAHYPASVVQRTGWMIEHASTEIGKDFNLEPILAIARNPTERTLLSPSGPRRGKTNPRWQVVVNTEVESDR